MGLEVGKFAGYGYVKSLPAQAGRSEVQVCKAKILVKGVNVSVSMYLDDAKNFKEGDEVSVLPVVYTNPQTQEKTWIFKYLPLGEMSSKEEINAIFGKPE